MRVIIAGSKTISDYQSVVSAIKMSNFNITEVVSGKAVGVDTLGERWAIANNVPIKEMPADWNQYSKSAGPIRNRKMAEYADAAIIVWDGQSAGAKNMIAEIKRVNKPYFIDVITDV